MWRKWAYLNLLNKIFGEKTLLRKILKIFIPVGLFNLCKNEKKTLKKLLHCTDSTNIKKFLIKFPNCGLWVTLKLSIYSSAIILFYHDQWMKCLNTHIRKASRIPVTGWVSDPSSIRHGTQSWGRGWSCLPLVQGKITSFFLDSYILVILLVNWW